MARSAHAPQNIVLTPVFLKANNIPYQVIEQQPGTLIYVRGNVYHQVVNAGLNLAEAMNVGGGGRNHNAHRFVSCTCRGCAVKDIPQNSRFYKIVRRHEARIYECPEPRYLQVSSTAVHARQHARVHRRGTARAPLYACGTCSAVFVSEAFLT